MGRPGPGQGNGQRLDPALEGAAAVRSSATAARPESARAESNDAPNRHSVPVRRLPVPPSADADVIKFEPTQGVQTFVARQPVLRIKPGDTVESRTFRPGDYYEKDGGAWPARSGRSSSKGCARRHARRPHHQSAPEPRHCRVESCPRGSALSRRTAHAHAHRSLPARRFVWTLDRARNMGILDLTQLGVETNRGCTQPDARAPRGRAAGEEAFGGLWPGDFGGNMDSPDAREGTTVYLPVFRPASAFTSATATRCRETGRSAGRASRRRWT